MRKILQQTALVIVLVAPALVFANCFPPAAPGAKFLGFSLGATLDEYLDLDRSCGNVKFEKRTHTNEYINQLIYTELSGSKLTTLLPSIITYRDDSPTLYLRFNPAGDLYEVSVHYATLPVETEKLLEGIAKRYGKPVEADEKHRGNAVKGASTWLFEGEEFIGGVELRVQENILFNGTAINDLKFTSNKLSAPVKGMEAAAKLIEQQVAKRKAHNKLVEQNQRDNQYNELFQ